MHLIMALLVVTTASACVSSPIGSARTADVAVTAESRDALVSALARVEDTVWPRPEPVSMAARFTGLIGGRGDRVTRRDALDIYLNALASEAAPADAIRRHAARQADAAAALAQLAETVIAQSANPRMSDVALLERAIVTLGESRSIYLSALTETAGIDRVDQTRVAQTIDENLRGAQSTLGKQADILAKRVMSENTRTIAASGPGEI